MSAIAGVHRFDCKSVDRAVLEALAITADPNPPESITFYHRGSTGLVRTLHSIASESRDEAQPFEDPQTGCVVVFDGRLDNREELSAHFDGLKSDAEFVLASYLRWGVDAPAHLLGDFAFAIWNPSEESFLLARDPFGVRPLYYSFRNERLVFASTLEQILKDDQTPKDLDESTILWFLYDARSPRAGQTFYRHISFLSGGHSVLIKNGILRTNRYFHLPDRPPEKWLSLPDAAEEFRNLLTKAVECRLSSIAPVGLMLSGGLDSSGIACVAAVLHREKGATPIRAYSVIFDELTSIDERKFSMAASALHGFSHSLLPSDDCWSFSHFPQWLPVFNDPFFTAYDPTMARMLSQARADGVRVMMNGNGGDHLLNGSARYLSDWLWEGRWASMHQQVKAHALQWNQPYLKSLMVNTVLPSLPVALQSRIEYSKLPKTQDWCPPTLRPQIQDTRILPTIYSGKNAWWYNLREQINRFGQSPHSHWDRLARLYGQELRMPYLDQRIVEFIFRTPPEANYRDGTLKFLVRDGLKDILPPIIRERKDKASFGPLLQRGIEKKRAFLEALLQDSELEKRSYVLGKEWKKDMRSFLNGETPPFWSHWSSITLEMWLRHRTGRLPQF